MPPDLAESTKEEFLRFLKPALNRNKLEILQLAGDASSRRYYRVVADEESWVLMCWDPFVDDGKYPFLSVRDHFAKHSVHVPNVVAKAPEQGLVLLEDLGDLTLERKFWENQSQKMIIPFYKQAIDEALKIHYPATFDQTECTAFKIEFDVEKLLWEMNYGHEHLLLKLCKIKPSLAEARALEKIFTEICTVLHKEQKFIAHRDYHSRNLMLKLGKMRVIDFQDARLGPVQYDLVSLLRDSYVRIDDDVAAELLDYYLAKRDEFAAPNLIRDRSKEKFLQVYELQTIQRCFKACGSFSSFYNLRQDTRYLKYIQHTLQTVKRSLSAFKEYDAFLNVLTDHGVLDRQFEST